MHYYYFFETKGIQSYLFESGKLRHCISGSLLLDQLIEEPLTRVLDACKANNSYRFSRRAGAAFYLLFDNKSIRDRVSNLWPLVVKQILPGVEFTATLGEADTEMKALQSGLGNLVFARNHVEPNLPIASPYSKRYARTGLAAVWVINKEPIDEATYAKQKYTGADLLVTRFSDKNYRWPNNFDSEDRNAILFPLENHKISIIHADGNGLGIILRDLSAALETLKGASPAELFLEFSLGLSAATTAAVKTTVTDTLEPHISEDVFPARPLVLGGDDLTIIVRDDLALDFAKHFLLHFEAETKEFLCAFKDKLTRQGANTSELPNSMTACAGIAVLKPGQPFQKGYELAESLCNSAKKQSTNTKKSMLAFDNLQNQVSSQSDRAFVFQGFTYSLSTAAANDRTLESLQYIAKNSCWWPGDNTLNSSHLRQIVNILPESKEIAQKRYYRWIENFTPDKNFESCWMNLFGQTFDTPFTYNASGGCEYPIADLLWILSTMKVRVDN